MSLSGTFRRSVSGLLLLLCMYHAAWGKQCSAQTPETYEQGGFVISEIRITSADDVFKEVQANVSALLAIMPLKPGNLFTKSDLDASKKLITTDLSVINPPDPLYTAVPRTIFEDCSTTPNKNTVKIIFDVSYLTRPSRTPVYEQTDKAGGNVKQPGQLRRIFSVVQLQPYVGFTGGKNLAGAGVTINLKNKFLKSLSMEGAGDSSSAVGALSVEGSRDLDSAWLKTLIWKSGYEHSDMPSENGIDIKKGTGYLQFLATTRSFKQQEENTFGARVNKEIIFRYGVALEGGNRQTDFDQNPILLTDAPSSDYRSLKAYFGSSWRFGLHRFKTSYGLQIGDTNTGPANENVRADFLKHIFDFAYKTRFYPWSNRPMAVEAQLAAGSIVRRGVLPVAERFFGGNIEQNFIAGDEWIIRSAPFIRSFPRLSLSRIGMPLPAGGERFLSINTTFTTTFWAKPAIPSEARREIPTAFDILKNEPKAEPLRVALTTIFVSEISSYAEQIGKAEFEPLKADLVHLKDDLQKLINQGMTQTTEDMIADCGDAVENALDIIKSAQKKIVFGPDGKLVSNGLDATLDLQELVIGFPPKTPTSKPPPAAMQSVIMALEQVINQNDAPIALSRQHLIDHKGRLNDLSDSLKQRYNNFQSTGLPEARAKAMKFLDDTQSQIQRVGRELNAFSIGPVFMFDAARLGTKGQQKRFRYGVGTGLQIEFFGVDVRAGYSFNPNRIPGEARGAFTFSFSVSDLLQ